MRFQLLTRRKAAMHSPRENRSMHVAQLDEDWLLRKEEQRLFQEIKLSLDSLEIALYCMSSLSSRRKALRSSEDFLSAETAENR